VDSDKDVMEAFQKALEQAQNKPEPKQTPAYEAAEENSDGGLMFSGSVSPDTTMSTQSNPALFTVYDEKEESSNQSLGLFLAGMIVLPIITGIISVSIEAGSEEPYQWHDYWSHDASIGENVTIQDEIYYVYEFNLGPGFESNYPPEGHSYWDIEVRGILGGNHSFEGNGNPSFGYQMASISGSSGGPYLYLHQQYYVDGNIWYEMNYNEESNDSVLINIDRQEVHIATKSLYEPESVHYWGQQEWESPEMERNNEIYDFLSLIIWPISIIGGIIWGFKTDRKPFAYGIMTAGLLAIVLPFVVLLLVIMLFGY